MNIHIDSIYMSAGSKYMYFKELMGNLEIKISITCKYRIVVLQSLIFVSPKKNQLSSLFAYATRE